MCGGGRGATRKVSRPASASQVAVLRIPSGGLAVSGRQMSWDMACYFAGISARHVPDPLAVRRVLEAVEQHSVRLDAGAATKVWDAVVSRGEVAVAIRHVKPGTAPGPDGLAPEVWRHCGDAATELLSAIGRAAATPQALLQGIICPIFKGGGRNPHG